MGIEGKFLVTFFGSLLTSFANGTGRLLGLIEGLKKLGAPKNGDSTVIFNIVHVHRLRTSCEQQQQKQKYKEQQRTSLLCSEDYRECMILIVLCNLYNIDVF